MIIDDNIEFYPKEYPEDKAADYPAILLEFASPFVDENDPNELFMTKIKIVELIWNYCIAKEFNLSVFDSINDAIEAANKRNAEMEFIANILIKMKEEGYEPYKHYIKKTELIINENGEKYIRVDALHPSTFSMHF